MSFKELAPVTARRTAIATGVGLFMPYTFQDENNNIDKIDEYLDDGYCLIGMVPHHSYGDFPRIIAGTVRHSREMNKRKIILPAALHQKKVIGLKGLGEFTDIHVDFLSTSDTKKKEAQLLAQGKQVPWGIHNERYGLSEFYDHTAEVADKGGTIFFAPQGGRRGTLAPFEKPSVTMLDRNLAKHPKNPRKRQLLAYFSFGLETVGLEDYSTKKAAGYNLFEKQIVTLGDVVTREELLDTARDNNRTLDEQIRVNMLKYAPIAYIPPQERLLYSAHK